MSVAYPLAKVGPDAVGGAEQILSHLDAALVRAGHDSIVVACEGSQVCGTLAPTSVTNAQFDERVLASAHEQQRRTIVRILNERRVDIVHMHDLQFYTCLPPPGIPVLVTLHLPPAWYPPQTFHLPRPHTYLHCVSASQRSACPPYAQLLPDIENGVPFTASTMPRAKRSFCLALGRICPEKGFHVAIRAATRARMPLLLAGEVFGFKAHQDYFDAEIVPRLSSSIRFIGALKFARKMRLLSAARCLLVPSLAGETSSLVAMEALACGTPVIASCVGALPDIIEHGRTGYLVKNADEMAEAIEAVHTLDPEVCRATARRRFGMERMIGNYFDLYTELSAIRNRRRDVHQPDLTLQTIAAPAI
jgi:hypothetical protein